MDSPVLDGRTIEEWRELAYRSQAAAERLRENEGPAKAEARLIGRLQGLDLAFDVLDNLRRAIRAIETKRGNIRKADVVDALNLIIKGATKNLETVHGVNLVSVQRGETLDPTYMNAIGSYYSDLPKDTVIDADGFAALLPVGGITRTVRAARVTASAGKEASHHLSQRLA